MPFRLAARFWPAFGAALVRRPGWVALVLAVLTCVAVYGLTRLRFDDRPDNAFRADGPAYQRLAEYRETFGSDDLDVLVILEDEQLFSPAALARVARVAERIGEVDGVAGVFGLPDILGFGSDDLDEATADRVRAAVNESTWMRGLLVADSDNATLLLARLDSSLDAIGDLEPIVADIRSVLEEETRDSSTSTILAGIPPLRVEIFNAIRRENVKFLSLGVLLAWISAWVLFRYWKLVLLVGGGPVLGMAWTFGGMGLVGEPLNVINVVLPALVIVIGLTNSVHLMTDLRRSLEAGLSGHESARLCVAHLGGSCGLAAATTAVGFASLSVSQIESIRAFGLVCAAGSLLAFLANILLLPWMARLWLTPEEFASGKHRAPRLVGRWAGPLGALDRLTARRPGPIVCGGLLVCAGLAALVPGLRPDSWLKEASPPEWESHRAVIAADELFGGSTQAAVVIRWPETLRFSSPEVLETLAEADAILQTEPELHARFSLLDVLRAQGGTNWKSLAGLLDTFAPEGDPRLRRLLNRDARATQLTVRLKDIGAAEYTPIFQRLDEKLIELHDRHPEIDVELTGTVVVISRSVDQMIRDLGWSLGLASGIIFLVITTAFRSLRIGLLSVLPNALPLLVASGLLVACGWPLQLSSVIVFSICLGIAVDDTIHFLNRYRIESEAEPNSEASIQTAGETNADPIRGAMLTVGPALVNSTVVLLAGFGSLLLSEMPTTRLFSLLSGVAILAALVGDVVFLPALLRWASPEANSGREQQSEPTD